MDFISRQGKEERLSKSRIREVERKPRVCGVSEARGIGGLNMTILFRNSKKRAVRCPSIYQY